MNGLPIAPALNFQQHQSAQNDLLPLAPGISHQPDQSYAMLSVFVHFEDVFRKALGPLYSKAEHNILHGIYDRDFGDKIRSQDPALGLEQFQFTSILQGSQKSVRSVAMLEVEASDALEAAKLKAWETKVLKEATIFWGAVKEVKLSYYIGETLIFYYIYPFGVT